MSTRNDQNETDRSQSPNQLNSDLNAKRSRIQAAFSSRTNANDKKSNPANFISSAGTISKSTTNSTGIPTNNNGSPSTDEHTNVVATLSQHASAAMPVATLHVSPNRAPLTTNANAVNMQPASSAKQFLIRRVRSRSKSDPQSVPEKSLFSRFFPKKLKKPLPALITTSSKSIDPGQHLSPNGNNSMTPNGTRRSTEAVYDVEDDEFDERIISTSSLSDTDHQQHSKENETDKSQSLNPSRNGTRTNSGNGRNTTAGPNVLTLPTSDSEYYASMTAAPKGFSISYHRRANKEPNDLRIQAALTRLQKTKQSNMTGVNQLQVSR